jgi:Predicted acyltransferases
MSANLSQSSPSHRILGLDGLRALSVLAVFFHHTGGSLLKGGYIGVEFFFVLSGFLITKILREEKSRNGSIDFVSFYMRRARRLYPALILLVLGVAAYCAVVGGKYNIWSETLPALFYVMNWYRAFDWYDAILTGHTWSLAIEEQYYLIWPLMLSVILLVVPRKPYFVVTGIAALVVLWRYYLFQQGIPLSRVYGGFDTHADGLLIGAILALIPPGYLSKLGKLWVPASAYLIVVLLDQSAVNFSLSKFGFGTVSLAAAIVIARVISEQDSLLVANLSVSPLAWLGKVSYGFYLWHYPVIQIVMYGGHDSVLGFFGSLQYPIPLLVSFVFTISMVLTVISWYLVEQPIMRAVSRSRSEPAVSA